MLMPQRKPSGAMGALLLLVLLLVATLMLVIAGLSLDLKTQLAFSAFIFVVCLLVRVFNNERAKFVLVFLTLLVSTRYIWWRATGTLGFTDPYSAVAGYTLFAAEIYAYIVLLLGYVQTIKPLNRKPTPLPDNEALWPTVDVFIPTYNEPLEVVAVTMAGAMNLEYPKNKLNVYLLDDGNRPEFKLYAAKAGVHYRSRVTNTGAKAGNLNEALRHSKGELVAIFDCDQIPVRSFLQVTAGMFLKDPNLAQVQTPQYFYTPDPMEKNLSIGTSVPNESSLFYGLIQDGNDLWNASYFCGSCAVLRRTAVADVGGVAEETVTEDAHTSLKLHRKGYNSAYLNEVQSAGLATESLSAHINQRIRWARGLAQIFRIDNPFLGRGLSLGQRLCYANATMHFLYAAPRLLFLIAPLFFLFFDLAIIQSEAAMVAAMALPHIVMNNITAGKMSGYWRHSFWAEIYETVLSFYIFMPTLVALIMPSKGKFNVTEKGNANASDYYAYSLVRPILLLGLLNAAAIGMGVYNLSIEQDLDRNTTYLNLFWASYNFIIIGVALGVAREVRQSRGSKRHVLSIPCVLSTPSGRRVNALVHNASTTGVSVTLDAHYNASDAVDSDFPFNRICFDCGHGLVSFSVEYMIQNTAQLRLRFVHLGFGQLRELVRLLYSPADRWHGVREQFKEVGIFRCLIKIVWIGLSGWWQALTGFLSGGKDATVPREDTSQLNLPRHGALSITGTIVFIGLSLLVFFQPSVSRAQDAPSTMSYELRDLTDKTQKSIELGTVRYGLNIPFAIRRDTVVNSGDLSLTLSWNDAGEQDERRLQVLINDNVLWTAPERNGERVQLQLPFDGVQLSDYNTLSFALEHGNVAECSISSTESFEVVIHGESSIEMDVTSIPIANELDTLPLPFFDDRDPRRAVVNFVVPANPSSETLKAAGRTAAWFGALASYRGVEFQVTQNSLPTDNAIVIAIGSELPSELAWLDAGEPRVLLVDNPQGTNHQLLVLTAQDDAGLSVAVDRLLESVSADILQGYPSEGRPVSYADRVIPKRWVDSRDPITLGSLVQSKEQLSISDNNFAPIVLPFEVPADFYVGDDEPHPLTLDYHYAPDFPDFAEYIHVSVNSVDLGSINIKEHEKWSDVDWILGDSNPSAGFLGKLTIDVPSDLIRSSNSIEVRFTAPNAVMTNCDALAGIQVTAGIDEDSTLDLSNGVLRGRYPDLSSFVNSGLPFTQYPDLRRTHIELPQNPEDVHYALYLNLMGRFAALTGAEPSKVSISRGNTPHDRQHNIVIAKRSDYLRVNSQLSRSPLSVSNTGLHFSIGNWRHLYSAVSDWINPFSIERQLASFLASSTSDELGLVVSARSATNNDGVALVFLADTVAAGSAIQLTLTDPVRLSEVRGSAVIADLTRSESIRTGRNFTSGSFAIHQKLRWWLSENLIVIVFLVCLLTAIFAWALPKALERIAVRRLH